VHISHKELLVNLAKAFDLLSCWNASRDALHSVSEHSVVWGQY